jgi:hypothetical protein
MDSIGTYSPSQLFDACRVLFPEAPIQQVFLEQLHQQNLKSAFRALAKEYHPDSRIGAYDSTRHTDTFRRVTAAYEMLSGFIRKRDKVYTLQFPSQTGAHMATSHHHHPGPTGNRGFRARTHFNKAARSPNEHYYSGPLPTIPLQIGLYLYYRSAVSYQAVVRAIMWQRDMRPPFGELASAWGWLDPYYISVIRSATDIPGTFGERAIKLGLLTDKQVKFILTHQKTMQVPLGRYFLIHGLLSRYELEKYLREHSLHNREIARGGR